MFASKRCALFSLSTLALVGGGLLHGCGGAACLRDSDCGSELECREGACQAPLVKGAGAVDDAGFDAATPDGSTPDASKPDGSKAGSPGMGSAGGGGEGGGMSGQDSP